METVGCMSMGIYGRRTFIYCLSHLLSLKWFTKLGALQERLVNKFEIKSGVII